MKRAIDGIGFGFISFFIVLWIGVFLSTLGLEPAKTIGQKRSIWYVLGSVMIVAPLIEEFYFRFLPLKITGYITKKRSMTYAVVIFVSIVFGWLHGSVWNIPVQGTAGFIYSVSYLRGGYWSAVFSHATHNTLIIMVLLMHSTGA